MGKTWRLLLSEAVAPMKAPAMRPAPLPLVSTMLSGTPVRMVFPWTTRLPSMIVIPGVTVIFFFFFFEVGLSRRREGSNKG